MNTISARVLPTPQCPVRVLRRSLELARADADEIGWFRFQSDCFTDIDAYQRNYKRCLRLKLQTERLIRIARGLLAEGRPAGERREQFVVSTVAVPPPRELTFDRVENRERALTRIAEQARDRVHRLGLLVQQLLSVDQLNNLPSMSSTG